MHDNPSLSILIDKFSKIIEIIKHENKLYISLPESVDLDDIKALPYGVSTHVVETYNDNELGSDEKYVLECDLVLVIENELEILFEDLNKLI